MVVAYIRVVPQFAPEEKFAIGCLSVLRYSEDEANRLHHALERRDVFARHQRDSDFYTRRARDFAERPVILASTGQAHRDAESLRREADAAEALLVLSTAFAVRRHELHTKIGAHAFLDPAIDLHIDGYTGKPSARTRPGNTQRALTIDARLVRRYSRLGFDRTAQVVASKSTFSGARVRLVCEWLLSSRLDPSCASAFIKTGTAAETLVAGESRDGVTARVSIRIAQLVASDISEIPALEKLLKELYGIRCDFAHGRHHGSPTPKQALQLEQFDRLVLLGLASFSHNCAALSDPSGVDGWFEAVSVPVPKPFSPTFVRAAMNLA